MEPRSRPFRLTLALCAGLASAACGTGGEAGAGADADAVVLTAAQEGAAARVPPRKLLTVRLRSQAATGYVWEVAQVDPSVLRPLDDAHEAPAELGGEAIQVHRFLPAGRGRSHLLLVLRRPWEDAPPLRTYAVDVDVDGPYGGPAPAPLAASGDPRPSAPPPESRASLVAADLPAHYSVCEGIACTPVKDQGSCGSCWAFATAGVVEQLIKLQDGQTRDLSEQYLVSCNKHGWSCNGGSVAFDQFIGSIPTGEPAAGAVYEASFPYAASDVACNPPHPHNEKLLSYTAVGSSAVADLKAALLAHGPLWTSVCADSSFSRYTGGVYAGSGCTSLNHAVVLVGWDNNGGQGYWVLRNSWGTRWGAAGYMNVQWGANGIGSRGSYYATYGGGAACTPTTCAAQGKTCGALSDGCGGTLACGACTAPATCGGGGVANVCGVAANGAACAAPYVRSSCSSFTTGTQVSAGGHNWSCASRSCTACAWSSSCAPGATGCPYGAVWSDRGACQ